MPQDTPYRYQECQSIVESNDLSADATAELLTACHRATQTAGLDAGDGFLAGVLLTAAVGFYLARSYYEDDSPSSDGQEVSADE
jgi:hypothetical protein